MPRKRATKRRCRSADDDDKTVEPVVSPIDAVFHDVELMTWFVGTHINPMKCDPNIEDDEYYRVRYANDAAFSMLTLSRMARVCKCFHAYAKAELDCTLDFFQSNVIHYSDKVTDAVDEELSTLDTGHVELSYFEYYMNRSSHVPGSHRSVTNLQTAIRSDRRMANSACKQDMRNGRFLMETLYGFRSHREKPTVKVAKLNDESMFAVPRTLKHLYLMLRKEPLTTRFEDYVLAEHMGKPEARAVLRDGDTRHGSQHGSQHAGAHDAPNEQTAPQDDDYGLSTFTKVCYPHPAAWMVHPYWTFVVDPERNRVNQYDVQGQYLPFTSPDDLVEVAFSRRRETTNLRGAAALTEPECTYFARPQVDGDRPRRLDWQVIHMMVALRKHGKFTYCLRRLFKRRDEAVVAFRHSLRATKPAMRAQRVVPANEIMFLTLPLFPFKESVTGLSDESICDIFDVDPFDVPQLVLEGRRLLSLKDETRAAEKKKRKRVKRIVET